MYHNLLVCFFRWVSFHSLMSSGMYQYCAMQSMAVAGTGAESGLVKFRACL